MDQKRNKARRLILRSVVLGGSVTAASKLIPENWVKPFVQSIAAPSHAMMSEEAIPNAMPIVGMFQSDGTLTENQGFGGSLGDFENFAKPDQSVLDFFIQPAAAGIEESICYDNVIQNLYISFNIPNNPGPVDVCLGTGPGPGAGSAMTTVDGTDIADFSFGENWLSFTDMVLTEEEITGTLNTIQSTGNQLCVRQFSAPLVEGVFSCDDGS